MTDRPAARRLAGRFSWGGAGLAAALLAPATLAAEPVFRLSASQSVRADENLDLTPGGDGVLISSTALEASVETQTETIDLSAAIGADLSLATGDGDTGVLNGVNPSFEASAAFRGAPYEIGADAFFRLRPVSFARDEALPVALAPDAAGPAPVGVFPGDVGDGDVTSGSARQLDVGARVTVARDLDARTRISTGGFASVRRFQGGSGAAAAELTESHSLGANVAVERRLSPRSGANANLSALIFDPQGGDVDLARSLSASVGFDYRATPRHNLRFSAGASFSRSELSGAAPGASETNIGFLGSAGLDYRLRDLSTSLVLSQSVQPSSVGGLQNQTDLELNLSYAVNARTQIEAVAALTRETSVANGEGLERVLFTFEPGLSYDLSPGVGANLGYRYRFVEQEGRASADSHAVFLTVSAELARPL